ncbi:YbhB/YbcL family Raf kinase inhibitor-like protein [Fusobacterium canifelinum]|uniref:YbhB/YbcL family Raf kinase inhibitor-like protein n=1 Tax=Fusobacterium canifelinum TaxID=285729 RepID=A0A3P1ULY1_9FUSO|nr:YbhB/YbcL family Raf kinase inhibitor-like protein [Fusobacterium canifelinum]RRD22792.1 YbhB/YbcL family Raf kinase inhibitor-like protein [Fusobacterium canifelinum]
MKKMQIVIFIILGLFISALSYSKGNMSSNMMKMDKKVFTLKSSGIKNGIIDKEYGGKGKETIKGVGSRSLPLEWENSPEGTQSYAIVMLDHDAISVVGMSWIHWTVANIPKDKKDLKANESRENKNLIQGLNSWISPLANFTKEEASFYGGPMPPKDHNYTIIIYALDTELDLQKGYYLNELYQKMKGHILATSVLEGVYKK